MDPANKIVNTAIVEEGAPEADASSVVARPDGVGARLRWERKRQHIGLRELARAVGVSASLISQVELGKATPSVGTLYAIVTQLGMSLDELFFDASSPEGRPGAPAAGVLNGAPSKGPVLADAFELADVPLVPPQLGEPVVRRGTGKTITLASGITWERLTARTEQVRLEACRYAVDKMLSMRPAVW